MEKAIDLIMKMVEDVNKKFENVSGTVGTHDKDLLEIKLQLKAILDKLGEAKDTSVWVKRTLIGSLITGGVGTFIAFVTFLVKGGFQ